MFFKRAIMEWRRQRLWAASQHELVRDYLSVPIVDAKTDYRDVKFLALDLETTGLDPNKSEILSVGFVPVYNGRVVLSGCAHYLVQPEGAISHASAVVHGITDDHAEAYGEPLSVVLPRVLKALKGHVLLAHHCPIELNFIRKACQRLYGEMPLIPAVDTLVIERQIMDRRSGTYEPGALRLFTARTRYNLPRYAAHDALMDAIACGELFLAQAVYQAGRGTLTMNRLFNR
ncbi:Exonuclease, RNase T and DNA polymerase III [Magnetococcus marinus MC-1]|uniref:Exonuclease, RNase T and DNA polymerase III n=1 Tax=Magnetococcus marinus (strain ATCC BAA-1437 / JCM 17883 / MC-1) TaxID=156889 RepID=A0L6G9_MAGMM|nr:exonuclease domain-containing protein [Magnetococcus marinus]ABK43562.1 Exonuclease, RNase T and DNA polymerase III [Magnetococcus marinus MC-1]